MTRWTEFAWCAFLYGAIDGDKAYQTLMNKTVFLEKIRNDPAGVSPDEIQKDLIYFLNQWRTRISHETANEIRAQIIKIHPFLAALSQVSVENVDLGKSVIVNSTSITVFDVVKECYNGLDAVHGIGPTATSKILHVLQPRLFMMWDALILDCCHKKHSGVDGSGKGYATYLQIMQPVSAQVAQDFAMSDLNPSTHLGETPAAYLSARLEYDPPKTMAKYLDEYNWVTVTTIKNGVKMPPSWHPEKGS